ncbi:CDC45-like protein-domain-containing protein [Baffinella frigidus]|nr:CDC45-like protein-domain-containing protein [Cryptophyta sp. CCMP2293]
MQFNIYKSILQKNNSKKIPTNLENFALFFSSIEIFSVLFCRFLSFILFHNNVSFIINPIALESETKKLEKGILNYDKNFQNIILIGFKKRFLTKKNKGENSDGWRNIYNIDFKEMTIFLKWTMNFILFENKKRKEKNFCNLKKSYASMRNSNQIFFLNNPKIVSILKNLESSDVNFHKIIWIKSVLLTEYWLRKKINFQLYMNRCKNLFLCLSKRKTNKKNFKNLTKFQLQISNELPLTFFRHWNIFDSMLNTPFFSINLKTWKISGRKSLYRLLTRLGFSGKNIKKPWIYLDLKLKNSFRKFFEKECATFGIKIKKIFVFLKSYNSIFTKFIDEGKVVSTFDWILGANSILDEKINCFSNKPKKLYWKVFDSVFDCKLTNFGINKGKILNKFVQKLSFVILSKKIFIAEKFFRYAFLRNCSQITIKMIKRLTFYLMTSLNKTCLQKKFFILIIHRLNDTLITCSFFKKIDRVLIFKKCFDNATKPLKIFKDQGDNFLVFSLPLFQDKLFINKICE